MRLSLSLLLLPLAVAASELGIETTNDVSCTRKTVEGDTVHMHYRGRLQDTNKEFDASYNRGKPLSFTLGTGRVIKG